jgi:hypothetical protein
MIPSAAYLFEQITRASASQLDKDAVGQVSIELAMRSAKGGFIKWIAAFLKIDSDALSNIGSSLAIDLRP